MNARISWSRLRIGVEGSVRRLLRVGGAVLLVVVVFLAIFGGNLYYYHFWNVSCCGPGPGYQSLTEPLGSSGFAN